MEQWQKSLENALTDASELAKRFDLSEEAVRRVSAVFPFRITRYYLSLIRAKGDPIYRQCVPDELELRESGDLMDDPLGEEALSPAPCIVHRYPDHCLLLVSNCCACYCRFCTRKRKFRTPMCVDEANVARGIEYIASNPDIHDVLVSGGDPLLLDTDRLESILSRLRAIEHVDFIRIGTRTPCVLPERINRHLVSMLRQYHPLYILSDAGIPLGSQTVLLRGVNDDPEVIRLLMRKLLAVRVKPYYLFQSDLIYGTEHFRTPLSVGLDIMKKLRGWTSGLAVPHFAIDLPCGGGKVPLIPDYLEKSTAVCIRSGISAAYRTVIRTSKTERSGAFLPFFYADGCFREYARMKCREAERACFSA